MVLRNQPKIRAPRNFTLSPQMAGIHPEKKPAFQLFPVMRLTSVLATLLFVFVVLGDLLLAGSQRGAPVMLEEAVGESAPQALEVVTEAPRVVEEVVESEVIVESEMTEKSLDSAEVTTMQAPALEMPSEGAALAPREEPLPVTGTQGPKPTIPLPTATPTPSPTAATEGERSLDDKTSTLMESPGIGDTLIRSRLTLRVLEVSLALLGVITAVLAYYLRPARRS